MSNLLDLILGTLCTCITIKLAISNYWMSVYWSYRTNFLKLLIIQINANFSSSFSMKHTKQAQLHYILYYVVSLYQIYKNLLQHYNILFAITLFFSNCCKLWQNYYNFVSIFAFLNINNKIRGHVDVAKVYRIRASYWCFHLAPTQTKQLPVLFYYQFNFCIIECMISCISLPNTMWWKGWSLNVLQFVCYTFLRGGGVGWSKTMVNCVTKLMCELF